MSWNTLDPKHQTHLEETLTRKQLDVLVLHLAGCSQRRIATMLGYRSKTTVADHLRAGRDALAALDRKDAA